jgi:hypothetical protein
MKLVVPTHEHVHMHMARSCETQTLEYRLVEIFFIWGLGWKLAFPTRTHHAMTCVCRVGSRVASLVCPDPEVVDKLT